MKSIKIRLELNNKQTTLANKHAGVARYAYNWASINLKNKAVSSTVTAFGDKSSDSKEFQLVDELGIKHQMFTFV